MSRRAALTVTLSVTLALGAGELLVRLLLPPPGMWVFPAADYGVMMSDPERGYAYAPNIRRHIRTSDYDVDFATNSLGMRDDPIDRGPPPRRRILALGDSYTQGLGVEAFEAWPKRLEASLADTRVYNAGVSGYGLHQMRRTAGQLTPLLHPDIVVVGVYGHGYHRVHDPFIVVAGSASPIQRSMATHVRVVPGGVLVPAFQSAGARDVTFWIDRHSHVVGHAIHLAARIWHSLRDRGPNSPTGPPQGDALREAMQPMLHELLLLRRFTDSLGVPLVALLINPQEVSGAFSVRQRTYNGIISQFASMNGLCVIDPLPALVRAAAGKPVLRFSKDVHWTPLAHEVAAAELLRALRASTQHSCRRAKAILVDRERATR